MNSIVSRRFVLVAYVASLLLLSAAVASDRVFHDAFTQLPNFTVEVDVGPNGALSNEGTVSATQGSVIALQIAPDPGYRINSVSGCGGSLDGTRFITGEITEDCVVTVSFAAKSFVLSFDAQGGIVAPTSKSVTFGTSVGELPTPTQTGRIFSGWNTQADGGGQEWSADKIYDVVGDSTLHAQWLEPNTYFGNAFKGPFAAGSSVVLRPLDAKLEQTGLSFSSQIINDDGEYSVSANLPSGPVEIEVRGTYFNEITGERSAGELTIRALTNNSEAVTVNVLTVLEMPRVKKLVSDGLSFDDAKAQALTELLGAFGFSPSLTDSTEIGLDSPDVSVLLAISAIVATNVDGSPRTPAELQAFLVTVAEDFRDGIITPAVRNVLLDSAVQVDAEAVRNNLNQHFESNGSAFVVPSFEEALTDALIANAYLVTASASAGGAIEPVGSVWVFPGATSQFDLVAEAGYSLNEVGGTCGGNLAGMQFATSAVTGDCTVEAVFSANTYTLSFDAQGGTVDPATRTVTFAAPIGSLPTPTRAGYTFTGWNTQADGGGETWSAATDYELVGNSVLYAQWLSNEYTITFDSTGGSSVASITQDFGTAVTPPADPTLEGFTFAGWEPAVPPTMPADGLTLTAQWTINQYAVTLAASPSEGGTVSGAGGYDFGAEVAVTAVANDGFEFIRWTEDGTEVSTNAEYIFSMPANPKALVANFAANTYTLSLDAQGGTVAPDSLAVTFNAAISELPTPIRAGHTFAGWNTDPDGSGSVWTAETVYAFAGDSTLYAQWTVNQYTITFDSAGGSSVASITQDFGTAITVPAEPTRAGFAFAGWEPAVPPTMPADGLTLTAQWTINQYAVTLAASPSEGGTVSGAGGYDFGAEVAVTAVANDGFEFIRWTEDGTEVSTNAEYIFSMPANPRALVANFAANTYTLSLDAQGGTVEPDSLTVSFNAAISELPTPSRAGHTFAGWNTDPDGSGSVWTAETVYAFAGDSTLYAQWTVNQYTITFDSAGGTEIDPITQDFGTAVTPPADPTLEGFTFADWEPGLPGTMPATDLTVTAQWTVNTYTVTPTAGPNGTITPDTPQSVTFDQSVAFSVDLAPGYSAAVLGSCGGTLDGNTFTTNPVSADCSVEVSFVQTFTDCASCPEMVLISGGSFVQGSEETEAGSADSERPARAVNVPTFAIGQTAVTFAQWAACKADGACTHDPDDNGWGRDNRPVINVTWEDAQEYVDWLSDKTGHSYRLPSESEWEYANRAGATSRFNTGDCITTDQANFDGRSPATDCPVGIYRGTTLPVASFAPNAFGLYDTHGNTWEWVQDCLNTDYNDAPSDGSAWMTGDCDRAVLRGGSLFSIGDSVRSARRLSLRRDEYRHWAGFRLARDMTYSVQTTAGEGGSIDPSERVVQHGQTAEFTVTPDPGYSIDTVSGCGGSLAGQTFTTGEITEDCLVTANFSVNTYSVAVVSEPEDGGTVAGDGNYDFGESVTVTAVANDGFEFIRWTEDGTEVSANPEYSFSMPANPGALVANFAANTYTLSLDAQGGTVAPDSLAVTFNAAISELPTPIRAGHTFAGWNTDPDGSGSVWTAETVYAFAGDSTLYAQWTVNQYTITFDSAGGTEIDPITQDFDTAITVPAEPTRTGFAFSGWEPEVPDTMPAENLTLVAQWSLDHLSDKMVDFMAENEISAGSLSVAKDGEIIFHQVYGWQDRAREVPLQQDAIFRIASTTKPITAAAIRALIAAEQLSLDAQVFSLAENDGGILSIEPFGEPDPRIADITIDHLLRHRGGWDRNEVGDLTFRERMIADEMGIPSPPGRINTVRYILGQPLQHDPGAGRYYSNIGYLVLGLVIEELSGQTFTEYVQEHVLGPTGSEPDSWTLSRTFEADQDPREPFYDRPQLVPNVFYPESSDQPQVEQPYGGWDAESRVAQGGIVTDGKVLLRFMQSFQVAGDGIGGPRPTPGGWRWNHTGSLPGTNSIMRQRGDGFDFVVLFNKRAEGGTSYVAQMREVLDAVFDDD